MRNDDLPFLWVRTNFKSVKSAKRWTRTAFYWKDSKCSREIRCLTFQERKINIQDLKICVDSTDSLCTTNPPESVESWEHFVWLACKRMNQFSESKLILLSVKSAKNWTSLVFHLNNYNKGHVIQEVIGIVALGVIYLWRPQKMINFVIPPSPPHPQKWTIDLSFKINRIRKYATNYKTPSPPFCVDVINNWSFAPQTFKTDYLTYLSVAIWFQERKIKNFNI